MTWFAMGVRARGPRPTGGPRSGYGGGPRSSSAGGPRPTRRGSAPQARTVAEVLGECLLTSSLGASQGGSAGRFLPPAQFRAAAPPYVARIAIGGPTLFRSLGADVLRAPTSPTFRVQSVATSGAGPPVPRISVAAASSALLGKRIAGVQALPEAMLAGPPKRVRAQEPTTAAAVHNTYPS